MNDVTLMALNPKQTRFVAEYLADLDATQATIRAGDKNKPGTPGQFLHIAPDCDRLGRSQTLAPAEREKYRDILFVKVVKNRHGSPDTEIAIRIDPRTLRLQEDANVSATQDELGRIAASAGGRGR
jgi:Terminase small subunit